MTITSPDIAATQVEQRIDRLLGTLHALGYSYVDTDNATVDLVAGYVELLRGIDQRNDGVRFGPGHAMKLLDTLESVFHIKADDAGQ